MTTGRTPFPAGDARSSGTFAGAEREQLRVWSGLTLRRKLEALEEMCDHARRSIASRQRRGLPYVDPFTGEPVVLSADAVVREDPPGPEKRD